MGFKGVLDDLTSLIAFFTPIPVVTRGEGPRFRSLYLLALVGVMRGFMVISLLYIVLSLEIFNGLIFCSLAIASHFIAQGFLHVDGFIDFSEAVLASRSGINAYRVLKDACRGSYAIAAFTTYVILLNSVLSALIEVLGLRLIMHALFLAEVWIFDVIALMALVNKAPSNGIGAAFKNSLTFRDLVLIVLSSLLITVVTCHLWNAKLITTLMGLSLALLTSTSFTSLISRKVLGFINGDVLGFASEIFYLLWLATLMVIACSRIGSCLGI